MFNYRHSFEHENNFLIFFFFDKINKEESFTSIARSHNLITFINLQCHCQLFYFYFSITFISYEQGTHMARQIKYSFQYS